MARPVMAPIVLRPGVGSSQGRSKTAASTASTAHDAMSWLHAYGQRMGRSFAHLCLLALVFVELQVTIPAEYSGLLAYVEAQVPAEELVLGSAEMPIRLITDVAQEAELSQSVEATELSMPVLVMPEKVAPTVEPAAVEV